MATAVSRDAAQTCRALIEQLLDATQIVDDASDAFDSILICMLHPDDIQRIKEASQKLIRALEDRITADVELYAFLEPEIGSDKLSSLRSDDSNTTDESLSDTSWT